MISVSRIRSNDSQGILSEWRKLFRFWQVFCLPLMAGALISVGSAGSLAYGATPVSGSASSAAGVIGKEAKLNGAPMVAGATLFPGDVIRLGEGSTAALQFGDGMVFVAAGSELVVEPGGVSLRNGFLQVRAGSANSIAVSAPFFQVRIAASAGIPGSVEIRLGGARAQVSSLAGAADLLTSADAVPLRLHAGESATLDAAAGAVPSPAQTVTNPPAGQVSRLTPQVQIDRDTQHIVANVSDRVYWNDDLRSGPTGRAHVTLKDGSQLNLGSDSSLRILQHDAQGQQTSLDLAIGRLRGKVTKLTRPGAKFEVHTPLGVAGLVGTDFSLLVTNDYVELMVFEGVVRFTPLSGQAVTVNAGMMVRISKSGAVEGPSQASSQQLQSAMDLTEIQGNASQGAVATATQPRIPLIITLTGTATGIGIGVWQANRPTMSPMSPK